MNIQITNITNDEVFAVRELGLNTPELHIQNGEPDYYSVEMLQSFITSPHDIYLAAYVDNVFAGYFLVSYNPYLKEAYLIDLVIKQEFRGLGITSQFFIELAEKLKERGCQWAWALVHQDNDKMMEIFKNKGFIKGRSFTFYFKDAPF